MGSYKYGYKFTNMGYNDSYLTYITPLITTHEPPSTGGFPVSAKLLVQEFFRGFLA